jgi:hypothetical protein
MVVTGGRSGIVDRSAIMFWMRIERWAARRFIQDGSDLPYKLVYKSPLRYKSPWFISPPLAEGRCTALTKFVWRTDHLNSKSLCYKSPPREGHLSRTGHIGGTYKPVYTVLGQWTQVDLPTLMKALSLDCRVRRKVWVCTGELMFRICG